MRSGIDCSQHDFKFTRNWFLNRNKEVFDKLVKPYWADRPCTYLELGNFEGMSLSYMLQQVLTHSESKAVGIDPWLQTLKLSSEVMLSVMERANHNMRAFSNVTLNRGCSAELLRKMQQRGGFSGITKDSVDLCMIDGNHWELAVLDDIRNAMPLLRVGGWLIMDDVENRIEKQAHVKHGLAIYLQEAPGQLKLLFKEGFIEIYEKQPCT